MSIYGKCVCVKILMVRYLNPSDPATDGFTVEERMLDALCSQIPIMFLFFPFSGLMPCICRAFAFLLPRGFFLDVPGRCPALLNVG